MECILVSANVIEMVPIPPEREPLECFALKSTAVSNKNLSLFHTEKDLKNIDTPSISAQCPLDSNLTQDVYNKSGSNCEKVAV